MIKHCIFLLIRRNNFRLFLKQIQKCFTCFQNNTKSWKILQVAVSQNICIQTQIFVTCEQQTQLLICRKRKMITFALNNWVLEVLTFRSVIAHRS